MENEEITSLPTPPTTAVPEVASSVIPEQSSSVAPSSSQTQPVTAPTPPPLPSQTTADQQTIQHGFTIDALLENIIALSAAQEYTQLAANLRETHGRESIFLQGTSTGEDPLLALDVTIHTLGVLYILVSRLSAPQNMAPPVPLSLVSDFCKRFDPIQARIVPERISLLSRAIFQYAEPQNIKAAIAPLYDLLTRYAPDLTYLTTIHQHLLIACISSQHYTSALPIITTPISNISLAICPDLTYNDHVVYHYTAGVAAAALRKWDLAADLLETCVSAPVGRGIFSSVGPAVPSGPQMSGPAMAGMGMGMGGANLRGEGRVLRTVPPGAAGNEASAVQVDAMKKLVLVQLVLYGQQRPLPKYTHASISRVTGQNSPYGALARAYPSQTGAMLQLVEVERAAFTNDGNMGLVQLSLARAPRWTIKQLTETYLTLGLAEIGRAIGVQDVEEVRGTVLSMIEEREINATISADGTVAFADDPPIRVSKAEMDAILARAQAQEKALRALEREMAVNKEYLNKAVRNRDDNGAGNWLSDENEWQGSGWNQDAFANL